MAKKHTPSLSWSQLAVTPPQAALPEGLAHLCYSNSCDPLPDSTSEGPSPAPQICPSYWTFPWVQSFLLQTLALTISRQVGTFAYSLLPSASHFSPPSLFPTHCSSAWDPKSPKPAIYYCLTLTTLCPCLVQSTHIPYQNKH